MTETPEGRGGRPRMAESSRRVHVVSVRFSADELSAIVDAGFAEGALVTNAEGKLTLELSTWIREAALEKAKR